MTVIANKTLTLLAIMIHISPTSAAELKIYKNDLYDVEWHDEITEEDASKAYYEWQNKHPLSLCPYKFPTQKSYINISKLPDKSDGLAYGKMTKYKLELTREQFEKLFNPIENHSKLYFHRIDLSNEDSVINEFIHDTNIKIDKVFEPDSKTIDIWYTKYIGDWK